MIQASTAQTIGQPLRIADSLYNQDTAYKISPDQTRVVYIADSNAREKFELFSVAVTGGSPVRLSSILPAGGDVYAFQISPDGRRVVYWGDQTIGNVNELFSVPVGGGTPVRLNDNLPGRGGVDGVFKVSTNGARVVYMADQNVEERNELFSVPIDRDKPPVRLNAQLPMFGQTFNTFQISPNGAHVVFRADPITRGVYELFSVPTDRRSEPVRLNANLTEGGDVGDQFDYAISPDGTRVVYLADQNTNGVDELFSVSIFGDEIPVRLNADMSSGGDVLNFQISSDSTRVVYRADQKSDRVNELFSVPINRSTEPVRLNARLVNQGDVDYDFQISPDSTQVVYRADQNTDGLSELFSVAIQGGNTPQRLNTDLPNGGGVDFDFQISPDGARVVYRADQNKVDEFELFSTPITGGATPTRLNGDLASNNTNGRGQVRRGFKISPDGTQVVYAADQNTFFKLELFINSIAGGNPVRLNSNLSEDSDVTSRFEISDNGQFVFYEVRTDRPGATTELYVVSIADEPNNTPNDELCVPIKGGNNKIAVICL